jgi:membrane-associated phospholipid phosphatase
MTRQYSLRRAAILYVFALSGGAQIAHGQAVASADTTHRAGKPLFTADDALLGLGFAGITVAMFPLDKAAARRLRSPSSSENRFIDGATTGFELMADPGSIIIGSGMYVAGRLTHHRELADVGLHATESIIVGSGITMVLKGALGRSRPFVTDATDPRDFKFGKGFGSAERQSFPSGHTTSAFAAAAAMTSEVKRLYPSYTWLAGPAMYGSATMVGLARMYHNKHWASDVALGAAIGTFSGLKIVRYSHNNPDNPFDRRLLKAIVEPGDGGRENFGLSFGWDGGH